MHNRRLCCYRGILEDRTEKDNCLNEGRESGLRAKVGEQREKREINRKGGWPLLGHLVAAVLETLG